MGLIKPVFTGITACYVCRPELISHTARRWYLGKASDQSACKADAGKAEERCRICAGTQEEIDTIVERNSRLIREQAATGMAAEEFDEKAAMLNEHYTAADGKLSRLKATREDHLTRSKAIRRFLTLLAEQPVSLDDSDEQAWNLLVSQVTIREDGSAEFVFRGEITITVKAK